MDALCELCLTVWHRRLESLSQSQTLKSAWPTQRVRPWRAPLLEETLERLEGALLCEQIPPPGTLSGSTPVSAVSLSPWFLIRVTV